MRLDDVFAALESPDEDLAAAAVADLLEAWEDAAPRCTAYLHEGVTAPYLTMGQERALLHIVHMLGGMSETAAFAGLCTLAGDDERASLVLGDGTWATLPGILVNCYAGDPAPLRQLIGGTADAEMRADALLAMAYLTQTRRIPRTEMHAYLASLADTLQPQASSPVWAAWVLAIALLGFGALAGRAGSVFDRGYVPAESIDRAGFRQELQAATLDPASLDGFDAMGIGPFDMNASLDPDDDDEPPVPVPVRNPLREIGRNDPCPCGSGKKYKKCCLV